MRSATQEQFRLKNHPILGSDASYGNNGFFIIPHPKIEGYFYQCQVSDGMGWEHVSVSLASKQRKIDRCPTWAEMCYIKELFWNDDECVVQFHPPKEDYVSTHPYCLHLWKPTCQEIPMPLSEMVGNKGDNNQ